MKGYQRKTLLIVVGINLIFGLQQYLINQVLVFPSPVNSSILLLATLFFFIMVVFNSTKMEKIAMLLFLFSAVVRFFSDSFILEVISSTKHETVYEWVNSNFYSILQVAGITALLSTLPIIAYQLKMIKSIFYFITLAFTFSLVFLAFVNLPIDPLLFLGGMSMFFLYVLRHHSQDIFAGISAGMHLWIIFFLNECFEYWNLSL